MRMKPLLLSIMFETDPCTCADSRLILLRSDDTDQGQTTLLDICLCAGMQYDNEMGHSDDHR